MIPTTAGWRKSTFCNGAATCVEVALLPDGLVALRDSKEQDGPVLLFTEAEWLAFTAGVRKGEFDLTALGANAGDGSDGSAPGTPPESTLADFGAGSVPA
jgi:hypothetical protein